MSDPGHFHRLILVVLLMMILVITSVFPYPTCLSVTFQWHVFKIDIDYRCNTNAIHYRVQTVQCQRWNWVWTFDPWPDPTKTFLTRWPDPVTECLCF